MTNKEKLWAAIEAYRCSGGREEHWRNRDALDTLIEELVQELQEPVAQIHKDPDTGKPYVQWTMPLSMFADGTKFYTYPPNQYPLPDYLYDSKDWKYGTYAERVEWLHTMYESAKNTLNDYIGQLAQQESVDCGECDCDFPCYKGKSSCIRLPQEPVAWIDGDGKRIISTLELQQQPYWVQELWEYATPLYASPPQRKPWVGLTTQEFDEIFERNNLLSTAMYEVIDKLKEKNA